MTGLSVVVVDDHHHCLPDIHLAIRQRRLPFSNIHVIHVDAHPDLSFPPIMNTEVISQPEKLYTELDDSVAGIAEFLLPLVFMGHVNQITWLKPAWATQMPTGSFKQLAIGKRKSNGAMGVRSEVPHFVEDELFCTLEDMDASSVRTWDLFATETSSSSEGSAVAAEAIDNARRNSKGYVLDIDLDYFSTWNPFRKDLETRIGKSAVKTVMQAFSNVRYTRDPLAAMTPEQRKSEKRAFYELIERLQAADKQQDSTSRRAEWANTANELAELYSEDVDAERILNEFAQVFEQFRDDEATRREIWAAGPYLNLPHHESSPQEIERMVDELELFLRKNALDAGNPPAIVAIAKSSGDEFLPPHQLDLVLTSVLTMLERAYGELETKFIEYESIDEADGETRKESEEHTQ